MENDRNKVDYYFKIFSSIRFFIFVVGIIPTLSFLLAYSFLYGYYFSGEMGELVSSFNMISNFIPFNIKTITMITLFFICIFYIVVYAIALMENNDGTKKNRYIGNVIVVSIVTIILTISLALFFTGTLDKSILFGFLLIVLFLGYTGWLFYLQFFIFSNLKIEFKIFTNIMLISTAILFFSLVIMGVLVGYFPKKNNLIIQVGTLILIFLLPTIIFFLIKNNKKKIIDFLRPLKKS